VICAVYALVALACTRLPLVNALGYESSLVFALLASAAAALSTIGRVRRIYAERALDERYVAGGTLRAVRGALLVNLLLLVLPLAVLLGNAFFVRNCSLLEGIGFFLLLPAVSVCFSTALAFLCAVFFRRSRTPFFGAMLATFCYALALGYYTPAVFSYNFFYGYFPGFTYDEGMRITPVLVSFRMVTLAAGLFLFWLGLLLLREAGREQAFRGKALALLRALVHPGQRGLAAISLTLAAGLSIFRCDLGYEATASFIREQLGGMIRTRHFVIYFPRGAYTPDELSRVTDEHEFRYHQIAGLFAVQEPEPVESYIYPSSEVKLRLIGAGNTNIAKPWSRQLHVTRQSLSATLKHELVHVMAARFGRPVIRASFSMGLTEGLAMAVDWDWGVRTPHVYAAAMRELDLAPEIATLMTPAGFMTHSSQISYVLAGSFCRFLMDRYGIRKLLLVYGSEEYARHYGRPLRVLIAEWQEFLDGIELDDTDLAAAEVFFRQPSIFTKTCPRVLGERNRTAARELGAGNAAAAESLYALSYQEGHAYDALAGLITAAQRLGKYDSVVARLDRTVSADPHPARFLPLSLLRGDACWGQGNIPGALQLYEALRTVDLTDAYTEASGVRLLALGDEELRDRYRRYFLTVIPDSVRLRMLDSLGEEFPDRPLLRYLRGRVALRLGRFTEAVTALSGFSLSTEDPVLESTRLISLGIAGYQTGDLAQARIWFWLSLNDDDSESSEHGAYDWIERCEWRMSTREAAP
jgi:hypothetical protein